MKILCVMNCPSFLCKYPFKWKP